MNAGSTTTAGSPESANDGRPRERVVAVELPRELEAGERERAVGELPDGVERAPCRARSRGRSAASSGTPRTSAWRRIAIIPST